MTSFEIFLTGETNDVVDKLLGATSKDDPVEALAVVEKAVSRLATAISSRKKINETTTNAAAAESSFGTSLCTVNNISFLQPRGKFMLDMGSEGVALTNAKAELAFLCTWTNVVSVLRFPKVYDHLSMITLVRITHVKSPLLFCALSTTARSLQKRQARAQPDVACCAQESHCIWQNKGELRSLLHISLGGVFFFDVDGDDASRQASSPPQSPPTRCRRWYAPWMERKLSTQVYSPLRWQQRLPRPLHHRLLLLLLSPLQAPSLRLWAPCSCLQQHRKG